MERKEIFNFPITIGSYSNFVDAIISSSMSAAKSSYVCVANVHMVIEAHNNAAFSRKIHEADMITPDGLPLTWALRLLYGIKQDRVAGMDLLPDLLKRAEVNNIPVFFVGGTSELLDKTKEHIEKNYPALKLAGCISPPFRTATAEETASMISQINSSDAGLLFVILGCPKQENWMASMKERLNVTMVGVGGALPVMVELQKRAPLWMQRAGFEWFYRLYQEPRRLFKRYAYTNSLFLWLLFKELVRVRILRKRRSQLSGISKFN
jgi:N-acetylglucosaminyldiphosphoundecaprenol N-acetyl-beta-D-mannosaminyltransferase